MFRLRRRCRERIRLAKTTPDHEGPIHPKYTLFNIRRSLKRICHYSHPTVHLYPHRRFEEIVDVIAIPSVMATNTTTVWEENSPEKLFILAAKCVLANAQVLFRIITDDTNDDDDDMCISGGDDLYRHRVSFDQIHDGLVLPSEVCDHLLQTMISEGLDVDDRVAKAFGDPFKTRLRRLELRNSNLTNHGFHQLAKHKFRELRLFNCLHLTEDILLDLNDYSDNLVELTIDPAAGVFPAYFPGPSENHDDDDDEDDMYEEEKIKAKKYLEQGYILNAPKLQRLNLRELEISLGLHYFDFLLKPLPQLTHLDLSGASHRQGFGDFKFLLLLKNLRYLVLHAVPGLNQAALITISKMQTLRHLDISQIKSNQYQGQYENPNEILRNLVQSLVNLSSLDISGTNLAGSGSYEDQKGQNVVQCDIPGLVSRVDRPLDFLGLYKTEHEASLRADIPAREVSGEIMEEHLLSAARRYLHRPEVLESVLVGLSHIIRMDDSKNSRTTLDITLLSMERYTDSKKIQMYCTTTLYYLVRCHLTQVAMNIRVKQKIISTLLNVMYAHRHDTTIVRNGCLTICQFQLPHDVRFEYEKLVKILLYIVSEHGSDEGGSFVQRAGICLLNSLAVQVDGPQKLLVGNLGAMEKMLEVIRTKLNLDMCDEVMETAWSTMWNITDETPVNCKRFLDRGGMELFLQCKERFYNHNDLLRNMMGLLGNVAEVKELRPQLMTTEFVSEFLLLVDSTSDGIETSYNAAGVLAHMTSDGADAWTIQEPSRQSVLEKMVLALNKWDIDTRRNINYRSFEPILRLVVVNHTPQCQHWAVWALANLTRTDSKYCRLIEEEGGLELLDELINSNTFPAPYARILELATIVRNNVHAWRQESLKNPGNMDESLEFDG